MEDNEFKNDLKEVSPSINDFKNDLKEDKALSKLSEITLEFLMKKKDYNKYCSLKKETGSAQIYKDLSFYQKRINHLTRNLMNQKKDRNEPSSIYPDYLITAFDNYLLTSIEYFKTIDKSDILQKDYIGLFELLNDEETDELPFVDQAELHPPIEDQFKSLFFKQNTPPNLLQNFIKVSKTEETIQTFPIQKEIKLDDPTLKMKGISYHKNNNIHNQYEHSQKKKK